MSTKKSVLIASVVVDNSYNCVRDKVPQSITMRDRDSELYNSMNFYQLYRSTQFFWLRDSSISLVSTI